MVNAWLMDDSKEAYIIKLMLEPPPSTCAHGTTARRPASHSDGRE